MKTILTISRKTLVLLALSLCVGTTANAGGVDDGIKALRDNDLAAAYHIFKPLADAGQADAQYYLAVVYDRGGAPNTDPAQGKREVMSLYEKAAAQKQTGALITLSDMYLKGLGTTPDEAKGMRYLRDAADANDPIAQYELGQFYRDGTHVKKDRTESTAWFRKASDQGLPAATFELSRLMSSSSGQATNGSLPVLKQAAESGYLPAMTQLGVAYHAGAGTKRDDAEAARWFQKSADKSDPEAQYYLARLYLAGEGVKKDRGTARTLLQHSSAFGYAPSATLLAKEFPVTKDPAKPAAAASPLNPKTTTNSSTPH